MWTALTAKILSSTMNMPPTKRAVIISNWMNKNAPPPQRFRLLIHSSQQQQQYQWLHCDAAPSLTSTSNRIRNPIGIPRYGYSCTMGNTQRQQYRTKLKLIDFDQFEPEVLAEKEEKAKRVSEKKRTYQEKKERDREARDAEERAKYTFRYDIWEESIRNLLNLEKYPVGFTNTYDNSVIASWCQQISHTLQQTLSLNASMSLELVLQLLDRLFQEQEAHVPSSPTGVQVLMSSDISSSAIESSLKSWKFSLLYPPFYEKMSVEQVHRAQERVEYYGKFLAKHDDSMLAQISSLLDVDRIVRTKTKTTDRLLWGHVPHTLHPNAKENNATLYWGYVNASETEIETDAQFFHRNEKDLENSDVSK